MQISAVIVACAASIAAATNTCVQDQVYCFSDLNKQGQEMANMEISDKNQAAYQNNYDLSAYTTVHEWTYRCTNGQWGFVEVEEKITGPCEDHEWKHSVDWVQMMNAKRSEIKKKTGKLVNKKSKFAATQGWSGFRIDMKDPTPVTSDEEDIREE